MSPESSKPKRVWPTLLIGIGILAATGFVAFLAQGTAAASLYGTEFPPPPEIMDQWMRERFPSAGGFARVVLPLHATMALLAIAIAFFSRGSTIRRLGLGRGSLEPRFYPVVALASLVPWALGSWVVGTFLGERSEHWNVTVQAFNLTGGFDAVFIVGWGVVGASFAEEVLFRGFLLRHLLRRWNAWLCIALTALLFAGFHPATDLTVYVLPSAIWAGILTWRFGSIWPAIVCHGFWNLAVSLLGRHFGEDSSEIWTHPPITAIVILAVALLAMVLSVPLLVRKKRE